MGIGFNNGCWATANVKLLLVLPVLLCCFIGANPANAWTAPKEKNCRAETPADEGFFSHCRGIIRCPDTCPDCSLSCKYCGMAFCPKCNKVGSVCQDPRFIGGDGVMFYFHGYKDGDFCIVSDSSLHINAHFIGKRTSGRPRDFTWVQALGILFDRHKLYIGAKRVAKWKSDIDQFVIYFDGSTISLPLGVGEKWVATDVTLTRTEYANALTVAISGLLKSSINIVPVTKEESRVHNYEVTDSDCFAHLDVNFEFLNLTESVSGVLGQTYAPNYVNPVKTGVPMPIMGGNRQYVVSSILTPDCGVTEFRAMHHSHIRDTGIARNPMGKPRVVCSSNGSAGSGFVCKR
eukprot:c34203_g1_i1 orf=494-1534(+)